MKQFHVAGTLKIWINMEEALESVVWRVKGFHLKLIVEIRERSLVRVVYGEGASHVNLCLPCSRYQTRFALSSYWFGVLRPNSSCVGTSFQIRGLSCRRLNSVSSPWAVEGPDPNGIDRGLGFSH